MFSFGVTAYDICTLELPTAIMGCLAGDPENRPPTMEAFLGKIVAASV